MAGPYSDLESKLEGSAITYLGALSLSTANLYEGENNADKVTPCVICSAKQAPADDPPFTGNYWVDLAATVFYAAAIDADGINHKADFNALVASVRDGMSVSDLATHLSLAEDFTAIAVIPDGIEKDTSGDMWEATIRHRVYCCASDL